MRPESDPPGAVRQRRSGATLAELAIALLLISIVLVSVISLFAASARSNEAANESSRANALARERLEQLGTTEFDDPALDPGFHDDDLPETLPSPGGDSPGSSRQPFRRTYRVTQFAIPDDGAVRRGEAFRAVAVRTAGSRFDFKRIDVTVEPRDAHRALGLLAVRVSAIRSNPSPDEIRSEEDPDL